MGWGRWGGLNQPAAKEGKGVPHNETVGMILDQALSAMPQGARWIERVRQISYADSLRISLWRRS